MFRGVWWWSLCYGECYLYEWEILGWIFDLFWGLYVWYYDIEVYDGWDVFLGVFGWIGFC